jgi:transposase
MLPQNIRIVIKHQIKEGISKSEVARQHCISRQTVYNIVTPKAEQKPRPGLLDPYKSYIQSRLAEYSLSAQRIFLEIKEQGYSGSYSTVKPFVRQFKKERTQSLVTERYETLPGKQAQMDWGECGVIEHQGKRRKLYVFTYVLGYSRMMYACFTLSMDQKHLLQCFQDCFERLGVPEKVLVDNMKTAVNQHIVGKEVQWNTGFLDFMEHHGVLPIAAAPYWPRVKGKVESGVNYVKNGFLKGQVFSDFEALNHRLDHWLNTVANVRIHGTTGQKPVDRYTHETLRQPVAYPMPLEQRKVAIDCHVSYGAARYSVPPEYVGKSVVIETLNGEVQVLFDGRLIARHPEIAKGEWSTDTQHMLAARAYHKKGATKEPQFKQVAAAPFSFDSSAYDALLGGVA